MEPQPRQKLYRATVFEIVGAWLHIWTPGRDTYIPPVPKFRLLLAAVLLVAFTVVTMNLIAEGKERAKQHERRAAAAADARIRARIAREQSPSRARIPDAATAGVPAAELPARRARLVSGLEKAITADAATPRRRHQLSAKVLHTSCIPYVRPSVKHPPEPPLDAATGKYECLGVTNVIDPSTLTKGAEFGYPYWARVDYRHGRAVWCKVNPRPGEMGIAGDRFVPLVHECDLGSD
jgi:hypothetical protein